MWRRRWRFSPSRETRVGETETGEFCPVSGGWELFQGKIGSDGPESPAEQASKGAGVAGRGKFPRGFCSRGKRPGTRRGNVLPN